MNQPSVIEQGDKESLGSDSDPSEDEMSEQELVRVLPKKLDLKKKKRKVSKIREKLPEKEKVEKKESLQEREK